MRSIFITKLSMRISLRFSLHLFVFIAIALIIGSCTHKPEQVNKLQTDTIPPLNKGLAQKPPMGWNSWDCLGWAATEADVRANAVYMAKNLKQFGYEYIIIDQGWFADSLASDFEAFVHETIPVKPNYAIDENGRLLPDPIKYPSSKGGKGFKPLADYIHSLGLKFGVHMLRGMPWQAGDNNMLIKGTQISTTSIAQPDKGCEWYDGFYGVDMTKPGAQEYYNSVFKLMAEWGIDFVKADDIVNVSELEGISRAIRSSGRDIVLSIVPDNIPLEIQKKNAHMARTGADFWDVWQMLKVSFPVAAKVAKDVEPGFWFDLDMLPVGKIGKKISYKGPEPRISNFNTNEIYSLLSLMYISRSPLMIGGYLPETDKTTLDLLTNEEALAVNRTAINSRQIKFKNAIIIWAADIPNSEDKYLALFNQWESKKPINIRIKLEQLGLSVHDEYKVRDLWAKKDLGSFKDEFNALINAHGAGLYKISKQE